jgi:hypothetical protein
VLVREVKEMQNGVVNRPITVSPFPDTQGLRKWAQDIVRNQRWTEAAVSVVTLALWWMLICWFHQGMQAYSITGF